VQGNSSWAVLPLSRHQCSIRYESSRVALSASKRKWALQISREWLKPLVTPLVEEYAEGTVGLFTKEGARQFGVSGLVIAKFFQLLKKSMKGSVAYSTSLLSVV